MRGGEGGGGERGSLPPSVRPLRVAFLLFERFTEGWFLAGQSLSRGGVPGGGGEPSPRIVGFWGSLRVR